MAAKKKVVAHVEPVQVFLSEPLPERHDGLLVLSKAEVVVNGKAHWELSLENSTKTLVPKS